MNKDPIWETAMDWLLRLNAEPHNRELHDQCNQWQAQAESHAQAWRKAEHIWRLSGQLSVIPPVPEAVVPRASSSLPKHAPRRIRYAATALAACLVLSLYVSLKNSVISTDHAELRVVHLDDGSRITLDANSAVELDFGEDERRVTLKYGSAFFEVARDIERPFVVAAESSRVEVLGTAFNLASDAEQLNLSVEHGSVRLQDHSLSNPLLDSPLQQGERVRIERSRKYLQRDNINPSQIAAWRGGMLLAQDDRLDLLLEQLERHYNGIIILTDKQLAQQRVTGAFHLDQPINALEALVAPFGGQLHQLSPWLIVVSR